MRDALCVWVLKKEVIGLLGAEKVEVIHLGKDKSKIPQAEKIGVKSVPALITPSGNVLHINYGSSIADVLKG